MTPWRTIDFDPAQARTELEEFRRWLRSEPSHPETQVCRFIRERPQLIASLFLLNAAADTVDRWAPELDLLGKHSCDLAVGDVTRTAYTLVEFEDAENGSIFKPAPATPYLSDRFNHGYAQIVDWLCLLDGQQSTPEFRNYWGQATPRFVGVLVIGRSGSLPTPEHRQRIEWRSEKVKVNSHAVLCLTYDDLVERLLTKLDIRYGSSGAAFAKPPETARRRAKRKRGR